MAGGKDPDGKPLRLDPRARSSSSDLPAFHRVLVCGLYAIGAGESWCLMGLPSVQRRRLRDAGLGGSGVGQWRACRERSLCPACSARGVAGCIARSGAVFSRVMIRGAAYRCERSGR
jgi:hypothetical protein